MPTPIPATNNDCGFMCSTTFFVLFGILSVCVCACSFVMNGDCDECLGREHKPLPREYQLPRHYPYTPAINPV